jgi:hypothetical protein
MKTLSVLVNHSHQPASLSLKTTSSMSSITPSPVASSKKLLENSMQTSSMI